MRPQRNGSGARWPIALILLVTAFCGACLPIPHTSHAYYLSTPVQAESLSVYFDERTLLWMGGYLMNARQRLQEDGACLHIARAVGDTAFWVDSLELPGRFGMLATWAEVEFVCPPETAPLHWHVITEPMGVLLQSMGDTSNFIVKHRCELSDNDVAPLWSRYPFVAMQCGLGRDSVVIRRVIRRPR